MVMKSHLPTPLPEALFYEDARLYACLASYPITRGHTVIVWKKEVPDLHLLNREEYEHLMFIVDRVRNALLEVLKLEKVYLIYMDEVKQVHWHLVPRYDQEGFNMLAHVPTETKDFSLAQLLKSTLVL